MPGWHPYGKLNHPGISTSLEAIGVRKELLDSTLRFSFSPDTTAEEVDYAAAQIRLLLPPLHPAEQSDHLLLP